MSEVLRATAPESRTRSRARDRPSSWSTAPCAAARSGPCRSWRPALPIATRPTPYDRRGRGGSAPGKEPYAVEREIEDLEAVIDAAGGSAYVCGVSSGAVLALETANRSTRIAKLALYEPPFIVDDSRQPVPRDIVEQFERLIATGRRGDAVRLFMKIVGAPAVFAALMRLMPGWGKLKAVAHTLPYDMRIMLDHQRGKPIPAGRWTSVTMPTFVFAGREEPSVDAQRHA